MREEGKGFSGFLMVLILDGTYLINRCARKTQSLSFDLVKVFDKNESSHKSDFFFEEFPIFLLSCAIYCYGCISLYQVWWEGGGIYLFLSSIPLPSPCTLSLNFANISFPLLYPFFKIWIRPWNFNLDFGFLDDSSSWFTIANKKVECRCLQC